MNLAKHYPEARLVHTGHSLGRIKLLKLLEKGLDRDSIEEKYNISKRIMVEEAILEQAEFIVASSNNEIDEQYGMYDAYQKSKFKLIPPGVDTEIFNTNELNASYFNEINRFLNQPEKPIILSICRPDERKNISSLIIAYGRSPALQEKANLVLVLGSRQDIKTMPPGPNKVLTNVLLLIDKFNLYGKVAYPKQHQAEDIPNIYKYAASTKGVFVNPALTEPFGLTLLEAASCRLPIVATKNGGPNDIVKNCKNGILIDTLNIREMAEAIEKIVSNEELWESYSENGVKAIKEFYSWQHHCDEYLKLFEQQKSLQEI
jgi:sucrose-phosphate synthase